MNSQKILEAALPKLYVDTTSTNTLAHCGTTKVFLTHTVIDILEKQRERAFSQRAFCIQCCWRRYRQRKLARQRQAATAIQAVARGWLTRKHIERMQRASAVIKRAWKKWKEKLEALAAVELDDISEMENSALILGSPVKVLNTSINSMQDGPLIINEVFQSWNLGFVLSLAPPIRKTMIADGFHKHRNLLACLNVLNKCKGYKVELNQSEHGIASIQALPQRPIKFHCKRSPLHFANVCPEAIDCGLTGLNVVLLEKFDR